MSSRPYRSVAAVRIRMMAFSLVSSGLIGGVAIALGSTPLVLAAVIVTGLFCSLLCVMIFQRLMSDIRSSQLPVMARLIPERELSSAQAQADDIKALFLTCDLATHALESQQQASKELLERIFAAQEKLTLMMHSRSTGNVKEAVRVRDAVTAMERLNSAFTQVIAEIGELSGCTEERASISTQMSATTDAIAENINQFSSFVIEASRSIVGVSFFL